MRLSEFSETSNHIAYYHDTERYGVFCFLCVVLFVSFSGLRWVSRIVDLCGCCTNNRGFVYVHKKTTMTLYTVTRAARRW